MATPTVVADPPLPDEEPLAPRRHRFRRRRWPRRLLIGLNVLVAVCLVLAASLYGYVTYRFGQIHRISIGSLFRDNPHGGGGSADAPGSPMNILVVGSDTRAFVQAGTQDARSFGSADASAGASDTM